MRKLLSILLVCALGLTTAPVSAVQDENPLVTDIYFKGNKTVSTSLLLSKITLKKGGRFSPTTMTRDVQTLYGLGDFEDIRVDYDKTDNQVRVGFILVEKPRIRTIRIEGNKHIKNKKILKEFAVKDGGFVDESAIKRGVEKIIEMYRKKGYQDADVTYETKREGDKADLTLHITEGLNARVGKIIFHGNSKVPSKDLRKVMKIRARLLLLFRLGKFDPELFKEDQDRILNYYYSLGYVDAKIKDIRNRFVKNRMIIEIWIEEGGQYTVGEWTLAGYKKFPAESLLPLVVIRKDTTFLPPKLSASVSAIQDFYYDKGYIDCQVKAKKKFSSKTRRVDIDFEIEESHISFINEVRIEGNPKTKDKVIRREVNVYPGEIFNGVKARKSVDRIRNLQYFDKVDSVVEPTETDNQKNLLVRVEEGKTGQLNFGAGYSSVDHLIGFTELSQNNFDLFNFPTFEGGGQKLKFRTQYGNNSQDFILSFTEPWLFDRKLSLGTDIYKTRRLYSSSNYEDDRLGFDVKLGQPLTDFLRMFIIYRFENVDIRPDEDASAEIRRDEGSKDVSSLGLKFDYDTRNRIFFPSEGMHHILYGEGAGLGGDVDYTKGEIENNYYFAPFSWAPKVTWKISDEAGIVHQYGRSDHVPIYERYFLGGPQSLRGFSYRDVSPRDSQRSPIGGTVKAMASTELLFPIVDEVRLAAFFDIGEVYADPEDVSFSQYCADVGVGLRLNLPIGPLSFDVGFPTHTDKNTEGRHRPRFQFSVGGVF